MKKDSESISGDGHSSTSTEICPGKGGLLKSGAAGSELAAADAQKEAGAQCGRCERKGGRTDVRQKKAVQEAEETVTGTISHSCRWRRHGNGKIVSYWQYRRNSVSTEDDIICHSGCDEYGSAAIWKKSGLLGTSAHLHNYIDYAAVVCDNKGSLQFHVTPIGGIVDIVL